MLPSTFVKCENFILLLWGSFQCEIFLVLSALQFSKHHCFGITYRSSTKPPVLTWIHHNTTHEIHVSQRKPSQTSHTKSERTKYTCLTISNCSLFFTSTNQLFSTKFPWLKIQFIWILEQNVQHTQMIFKLPVQNCIPMDMFRFLDGV